MERDDEWYRLNGRLNALKNLIADRIAAETQSAVVEISRIIEQYARSYDKLDTNQ